MTLAIGALVVWVVLERTLLALMGVASTLPATSASQLIMQLWHFEGSTGV